MRPVAFTFSAAADAQPLSIDRDTVLSYVVGRGSVAISTDQNATIANSVTTPAGGALKNMIFGTGAQSFSAFTDFPLSAGEVIYLSSSAAGIVMLYFTDVLS